MRSIEAMAIRLARWTKAGRWENSVLVEASPHSDGWRSRVTLFMPGERSSINYQLRKRAQLDNCLEEEGQERQQAVQPPTNSTLVQCKIECDKLSPECTNIVCMAGFHPEGIIFGGGGSFPLWMKPCMVCTM